AAGGPDRKIPCLFVCLGRASGHHLLRLLSSHHGVCGQPVFKYVRKLCELYQESVMPVRGSDDAELSLRDVSSQLLLLLERVEYVGIDADNQRRLFDLAKSRFVGTAPPPDIVRIHLFGQMDVAVRVEAIDKFLALVSKVALHGEKTGVAILG